MTGTESRAPWRLRSLLLAVYSSCGVVLILSAMAAPRAWPPGANLLAAALIIVVVERTGFMVALGAAKIRVDWVEAAVVLGLVLLPAPWFVLVTPVMWT